MLLGKGGHGKADLSEICDFCDVFVNYYSISITCRKVLPEPPIKTISHCALVFESTVVLLKIMFFALLYSYVFLWALTASFLLERSSFDLAFQYFCTLFT